MTISVGLFVYLLWVGLLLLNAIISNADDAAKREEAGGDVIFKFWKVMHRMKFRPIYSTEVRKK